MNRIRNPFGRKPAVVNGLTSEQDENQRPTLASDAASQPPSFAGSKASSSLSITKKNEEPNEYKLSVVNDSGVYLPPSPPEKKSIWPKAAQLNGGKSNHRSMLNENEPFSISRESFESYRRSFDISARSPVPQQGEFGSPRPSFGSPRPSFDARKSFDSRQSLDSKNVISPRATIKQQVDHERRDPTVEERFEDVGLNDEAAKAPHKKKGIFSRFGDNSDAPTTSGEAARPSSSHRGFHLPGRKRGQSGQGAELGNMDQLATKGEDDGVVR